MDIANKIIEATEEVFNTMVFLDVSTEGCMIDGKEEIFSHISAMIGLSGDITAMISIHCSGYIAMEIAGAMLDTEYDDIDDDVKDSLGEIVNMVAGCLKTSFADDGLDVTLSIPTTVSGKSYSISSPKRSNRLMVPFDLVQGQFFVEMKYSFGN